MCTLAFGFTLYSRVPVYDLACRQRLDMHVWPLPLLALHDCRPTGGAHFHFWHTLLAVGVPCGAWLFCEYWEPIVREKHKESLVVGPNSPKHLADTAYRIMRIEKELRANKAQAEPAVPAPSALADVRAQLAALQAQVTAMQQQAAAAAADEVEHDRR